MQLLGCSLDSLIGRRIFRNRSLFFRFANQMLTVSWADCITSAALLDISVGIKHKKV